LEDVYYFLSGIIMFVSGFLEFGADKIFLELKVPYKKKHETIVHHPSVIAKSPGEEKPKESSPKDKKKKDTKGKSDYIFCTNCGRKLNKDSKFCDDCGYKI
jgi:hypothetical protein